MTEWHANDGALARYAGGTIDDVAASSIEAHLVTCGGCRQRVTALVSAPRLEANWLSVTAALDAPRPGLVERALVRLGVNESTARLLLATPPLRASWAASIGLALLFASFATVVEGNVLLLILAPLMPVTAVAVAFSDGADPARSMVAATPTAGPRLLLVRSAAALVPSLLIALVLMLATDAGGELAAWLLPALALSALSLAAARVVPIATAATGLATAWAVTAVLAEVMARGRIPSFARAGAPQSVVFATPGQVVAALLLAAAVASIAMRPDALALDRSRT